MRVVFPFFRFRWVSVRIMIIAMIKSRAPSIKPIDELTGDVGAPVGVLVNVG